MKNLFQRSAADKAEYDKFIAAYITETEAYEKRKEEAVRSVTPMRTVLQFMSRKI